MYGGLTLHTANVYNGLTMRGNQTTLHRRINITLPEETMRLMDRVAPKGDRSRLIGEAVRHFLQNMSRAELRRQLREGARRRAERDLALSREWFFAEEEVWRRDRR